MHIQGSQWPTAVATADTAEASDGGGTNGHGKGNGKRAGAGGRSTPLRVDAQRNLEHVLRAAREVFGELGYGAPMEDVARRARVGVGTVYRRFPSKDVLVRRIAEEETARLTDQARTALGQEDDAWSALSRFLRTSVASGAGRLLPPSIPGSLALQRVKITEGYLLLRVVARDRAVGMGELPSAPPGRGPVECRLGAPSAPSRGMQQTSRILVIVTLCRYEPTHGHTSSVADRTDIRQTSGARRGVPHSGPSLRPGADAASISLAGRDRQLVSLCRPVPAASSNSARGFSSEPSETISRLNRPARVHSASTRALRLKVGIRLRW